jgi:hypothetical protein
MSFRKAFLISSSSSSFNLISIRFLLTLAHEARKIKGGTFFLRFHIVVSTIRKKFSPLVMIPLFHLKILETAAAAVAVRVCNTYN